MILDAENEVLPALEGLVSVTSVTAGAASGAITIANLSGTRYVRVQIDDGAGSASGAYITVKRGAAPADPSPTATTGTGRTQWYPAADMANLVFSPGDQIKVYVPGSGTYYVRQNPSGPTA